MNFINLRLALIFGVFSALFLEINCMEGIEGRRGTKRGMESMEIEEEISDIEEEISDIESPRVPEKLQESIDLFFTTPKVEKKVAIYDFFKETNPELITQQILPWMKNREQIDQGAAADLHLELATRYEKGIRVKQDLEHAKMLYEFLANDPYAVSIHPDAPYKIFFKHKDAAQKKLTELNLQLNPKTVKVLTNILENYDRTSNDEILAAYEQLRNIDPNLTSISSLARGYLGSVILVKSKGLKDFNNAKMILEAVANSGQQGSRLAKFYLALFYDDPAISKDVVFNPNTEALFKNYLTVNAKKDLSKARNLYKVALESQNFMHMKDLSSYAKKRIDEIGFMQAEESWPERAKHALINYSSKPIDVVFEAYKQIKTNNPEFLKNLDSLERVELGGFLLINSEGPEYFKEAKQLFEEVAYSGHLGQPGSRLANFYLALFYDDPTAEKDAIFDKKRRELFEENFDQYGEINLQKALQSYSSAMESEKFKQMKVFPGYARQRIAEITNLKE